MVIGSRFVLPMHLVWRTNAFPRSGPKGQNLHRNRKTENESRNGGPKETARNGTTGADRQTRIGARRAQTQGSDGAGSSETQSGNGTPGKETQTGDGGSRKN